MHVAKNGIMSGGSGSGSGSHHSLVAATWIATRQGKITYDTGSVRILEHQDGMAAAHAGRRRRLRWNGPHRGGLRSRLCLLLTRYFVMDMRYVLVDDVIVGFKGLLN